VLDILHLLAVAGGLLQLPQNHGGGGGDNRGSRLTHNTPKTRQTDRQTHLDTNTSNSSGSSSSRSSRLGTHHSVNNAESDGDLDALPLHGGLLDVLTHLLGGLRKNNIT
jgi:hypothetical protein